MTLCAYDVDCDDVLDLTNPSTLAANAIAPEDLSSPWKDLATRGLKPPTWLMAERLIADKVSGIIVPSFARGAGTGDINVVFWSWKPDRPHQVKVIDDFARLPSTPASWS